MKIKLLSFLVALFALITAVVAQSSPPPAIYEDGILHIKIKDSCEMEFVVTDSLGNLDTTQLVINGINFNYFGISKIEKTFKLLGQTNTKLYRIYTFHFPLHNLTNALIDSLLKLSCVEYAERVPKIYKFYTPTDIRPQTGSPNQWYLYTIKAKEAWDVHHGPGAKPIKIAIVDDAVWLGHPELASVLYTNTSELLDGIDNDNNGYIDDVQGWDAANNDNDPNPPFILPPGEDFTHGTHVAALAVAQTDLGSPGMASIGFGVKLIPVKVGLDATAALSAAYPGVEYAVAAGADVINMSWGGPGYSNTYNQMMNDARARGIVLVAAAGNDNVTTLMYPASYPAVISVGATNSGDQKTWFSNYNTSIDVMAPGEDIYSALYDPANTTIYGNLSGTSMASPLVAGLCGLMLSYNSDLTPDAVENCLKANCDNINAQNSSHIGMIGSGRINAEKTMKCLQTAPQVDFTSNFQTICHGKTIRFACNFTSGNNSPTYSWNFPGGSPSTSTSANPAVTYTAPGVYSVSVVITNAFGSTTLTKTNYITVKSTNANYNYGVNVDNNWFIHTGLALEFPKSTSSNPQLIIKGNQNHSSYGEGCASISNYDGQPLFYSNGFSVYNRHHQVMSNGSGLSPAYPAPLISTVSQNTVIVPDPNECSSLYYLFHLNPGGLLYSVIDMNGDNGLGAVTQKNVQAGNPFSAAEHLTAVMHCNGKDVWVIAHEVNTNAFRAHLVTAAGVSPSVVISNVGFAHDNSQGGQMKGSPGGDKIARAIYSNADLSQIFDFDKGTGIVSNPIKFNTSTLSASQKRNSGIEFSADGSKIYLVGSSLVQYNLNGFSASTLPTVIASSPAAGGSYGGTLELGPDGKIYATKTVSATAGFTRLDVIADPNKAGTACNLIPNGMPLTNPNGINHFQWGMNNTFISKSLNNPKELHQISYNVVICNGGTAVLDAGPAGLYDWEGGQSTRKIIVNQARDYPVIITDANGCKTKVVFVVSNETAAVNLGPDRTYICGQPISIVLDAGVGYISFLWSTGETSSSIIATAPGLYWVEVTTPGGCKIKGEVMIVPVSWPQQAVTRVNYTCGSPGLDLDALNANHCPLAPDGSVTSWLSSIDGFPATMPVVPIGNMNFRREFMDATGCVYCTEVIDITLDPDPLATVVNNIQLACEGDNIILNPLLDPPCNTATAWEYTYPNGTIEHSTIPYSISNPAINGDSYKIRSLLPNGCYCEYTTGVIAFGPVIKKKTITINCGQAINLKNYEVDECSDYTNYYWGEKLGTQLPSYVVSPKQTKTYYWQSYNAFGCPVCVFELTVVIDLPVPASYNIEVPCGTIINMEDMAGCNGEPGTFYWFDGSAMGQHPLNNGIFVLTKSTTYYRESLNGCPCPSKVTVNVTNPISPIVEIPSDYCYGMSFDFKSLCPEGTGSTTYKLLNRLGEVVAASSSPSIVKELLEPGPYKLVAVYDNGCSCTTEYRTTLLRNFLHFNNSVTIIFCSNVQKTLPKPHCPEAAYYKWFSNDKSTSFISDDGSITLQQRIALVDLVDPNPHDGALNIYRYSYDANGCIICFEEYRISRMMDDVHRPKFWITKGIALCPGDCYTFNPFDFFPQLTRCQFVLQSPTHSAASSITTNPDGSITVCVNNNLPQSPGFVLRFACTNSEIGCTFEVNLWFSHAYGCKTGEVEVAASVTENPSNNYRIDIFPNPTPGIVTVDVKGSAGIVKNIQVFDVLGRRIITAIVAEEQKDFNLSEFSKGIYTIRVETDEKVYTEKVVLK